MFRLIKITFNAILIVLAIVGFNAIGGQKYIEAIKGPVGEFFQNHKMAQARKMGDFSKLNEEFQIDNTMTLAGYKAVIAEHKASGQKMVIIDTGNKPLLTKEDIQGDGVETKLKALADKFKYQGISVKEVTVTNRGMIDMYGQTVPYAKFEAHVTKLPFSDIGGIVASIQTSDGSEKLALSLSEKKKYSQLIANEFYRGVKEGSEIR